MKLGKYLFWVGAFSLLGAIYASVYVYCHSHQTKTLPKKAVYFSTGEDKLPIFFIKKLKFREAYVGYVNHQLDNRIHEVIEFPYQNGLAKGDTIYIRKYLKDSVLVEFYCPKYHDQIWGLATGYLHRSLIHNTKD